jgi:Asp-tRNA(Asn)/Glu-tRNA(Gln) amidotransferase A subunit family amidase
VLLPGWDERSRAARIARPALGVPTGPYLEYASEEGRQHFQVCLENLRRSGWEIVPVNAVEDLGTIVRAHWLLIAYECAAVHATWFDRFASLYSSMLAELIQRGRSVEASVARAARDARLTFRAKVEVAMEASSVRFMVAPGAVGPAPRGLASTGDPTMSLPWSYSGLPTLAIPAGLSREGLPMGIQVVGRYGRDEDLFELGPVLEEEAASWAPPEIR